MKILFIPNQYQNLYKIIEDELISQGHVVTTVLDPNYRTYAWARKNSQFRFAIKKYFTLRFHLFEKFWKNKFLTDDRFNQYYDLLFCIQGLSFSPLLLEHLRIFNSNIKSSLYIWDSNLTLDFFHNVIYFDKVYSFDWYDVQHDENNKVAFLPFFWPKSLLKYDNEPLKYDISCIGSCHDGRLQIFKNLIPQFDCEKMSYYLKLYIKDGGDFTFIDRIKLYYIKHTGQANDAIENFMISKGLKNYSFIINNLFTPDEAIKIMAQSKAILDTDRELQNGTTPRFIWALALNKHIFTTNEKSIYLPFFNKDYIHFIDRNKPYIDFSLMKSEIKINSRESVDYLRIDKWVQNFL